MITILTTLLACRGGPPAETDVQQARVTVVETYEAHKGSVGEQITTTAAIQAVRAADVTPVNPGVVKSIHADDGDAVSRGQLLAVLENIAIEANTGRAQAEVRRLEDRLQQTEQLAKRGAVSQREVDDLRYQLQTARQNAAEASRSYGQTRLTAPFDGVVARRDIKVGEIAQGRAFRVVDLSELEVRVDLPERDLARVAVGQPVSLVSAYDDAIQGAGVIERIAPVIDPATGTFRVTVDVAPGQMLRPGQFVNAHIEVDRHQDVLVLPRRALVWEDGRAVVYVMQEPDTVDTPPPPDAKQARRTAVSVGLMDDRDAEITTGLTEGDQVIVVGQATLKDGAFVRPAPPSDDDKVEEG